MSPRAACRLETLGFEHVYDYMPGKADWFARGLAREGSHAGAARAIDLARQDAVTCGLTDAIGALRACVDESPYDFALVVADDRVVLGQVGAAALRADATLTVEAVMEPGPSTIRADADPRRLHERLERQNLAAAIVTDPDGRLVGIVRRTDLPDDMRVSGSRDAARHRRP